MYIPVKAQGPSMLGVHVDDIIVVCSDADRDALVRFPRKNLPANFGDPTYYTGCVFEQDWEMGTFHKLQTA